MNKIQSRTQRITILRGDLLPARLTFERSIANLSSSVAAFVIVVAVVAVFMLLSDRFHHWFVIPVSACGVLIGTDAIDWIRARVDLYDPVGILGILGFHFFFLAPLLHVQWDFWMGYVSPPPDWREWLGYMGILNAMGLACYCCCYRALSRRSFIGPSKTVWRINKKTFNTFAPLCLAVATVLQLWVYARLGGISGYMQTRLDDPTAFKGMGWIFMISESAPVLLAFIVVVRLQQRAISWSRMILALFGLFAVEMIFGGLRGSRSETIELLFWVVGCIHFLIRPVPRKLIYCGCIFLAVFMYFYGFYKTVGTQATEALSSSEERNHLAQTTGRTSEALVLGDLSRADVQAFILYRLMNDAEDVTYAKGRTYIGSLSLFIPRWILPERPETVVKEGTEIQAGSGSYVPDVSWSSKVYGLAGESMLNFGFVSVPFVYALFGLLVGWFRSHVKRLAPGDARFLLVPFGVFMCVSVLAADLDNLTFGLAKNGAIAMLLVVLCSSKLRLRGPVRVTLVGLRQQSCRMAEHVGRYLA